VVQPILRVFVQRKNNVFQIQMDQSDVTIHVLLIMDTVMMDLGVFRVNPIDTHVNRLVIYPMMEQDGVPPAMCVFLFLVQRIHLDVKLVVI
jgi:hypothetical protein